MKQSELEETFGAKEVQKAIREVNRYEEEKV